MTPWPNKPMNLTQTFLAYGSGRSRQLIGQPFGGQVACARSAPHAPHREPRLDLVRHLRALCVDIATDLA